MQASNYIQAIEERQGLMVACLEEIAFRMGYITADDLARLAAAMASSAYGQYLPLRSRTRHNGCSTLTQTFVLQICNRVANPVTLLSGAFRENPPKHAQNIGHGACDCWMATLV